MKPELIIENCITQVQEMGLEIVRGPILVWGPNDKIEKCNCSGAVLILNNRAKRPLPQGWVSDLCVNLLGKDTYWWWRFSYGFNQGRSLEIFTEDDNGKRIYFEDKVSKYANRLARNLGLYSKR